MRPAAAAATYCSLFCIFFVLLLNRYLGLSFSTFALFLRLIINK